MNDWKTTVIQVRHNHEWGTFFVRESPVIKRESHGWQASAEWTANTSFGCFGHYWHSMGEPFGEFIKGVDEDYLLGKIGHKVTDERHVVSEVKRLVREARKSGDIDADTAREAYEAIEAIASEHTAEILCHELYRASELSFISDWCAISSQTWDGQSLGFARKLWPEFVKQFNAQAAEAAA